MIGEYVIVRTARAGVHMGVLREQYGTAALLADARRLWSWKEAFSLHEASLYGVGEDSKISDPVGRILLTEAIEVIVCTEQARLNLTRSRNNPGRHSG